jgi:hypothetical protein
VAVFGDRALKEGMKVKLILDGWSRVHVLGKSMTEDVGPKQAQSLLKR